MKILIKIFKLPLSAKAELFLYPLLLIWRMPIAWIKSLWHARILLNGQWHRYMGFHPCNALNSFFYRTQWLNIERYGRRGKSPVVGLGDHSLASWFHYSLPAGYIYANAGAVTTLASTLVWVFSHLIWLESADWWWVLTLLLILLFSTTSYAMAFARQNYQILGWMWYPLALYAVGQGESILASFAWFAAAIFGITPIFFGIPVVVVMAMMQGDLLLIWTIAPAVLLVALRFMPLLLSGSLFQTLNNIAKLIGASRIKVRYNRGMNRFGIVNVYYTLLYLSAFALLSVSIGKLATLPLVGVFIYLINQRFFRVADEQSLYIIVCSLFMATALTHQPHILAGLAVFLSLNPCGLFLSIQELCKDRVGPIHAYTPYDHRRLLNEVYEFMSDVPYGEKIYFAFDDPNDSYSNIFDGYRIIHELPLFVASDKGVHLFPDWYAVSETNYEGAPQIWGREPDEVKDNLVRWATSYVIVYQTTKTDLDERWREDFELVAEFEWSNHLDSLRGVHLWSADLATPKWFLLKLRI